jgi:hypothetical protein
LEPIDLTKDSLRLKGVIEGLHAKNVTFGVNKTDLVKRVMNDILTGGFKFLDLSNATSVEYKLKKVQKTDVTQLVNIATEFTNSKKLDDEATN